MVTLVAIAACGGDSSESSFATTAAGSQAGADEAPAATGGVSDGSAAGGLPVGADDDFPIAIPAGWLIDFYERTGLEVAGSIQVMYGPDEFDDIVAFYSDWTDARTEDYTRIDSGDVVIFQNAVTPVRRITITGDYEEGGERYTLLQAVASRG